MGSTWGKIIKLKENKCQSKLTAVEEMATPQINSSSKSGTPLPCGNGKERLTVVLFAETILWTFALNAKPLKKMNKTKNAMSLGEHAIMLSISIASQDG